LTALPFIFGVWIVQRESFDLNMEAIRNGCAKLIAGKQWGTENISKMCTLAAKDSCLNTTEMCSYFDGLVYDFGENEIKGLELFYQHLQDNGIIEKIPELHFLPQ